ncbi:REM2- and Rab-like small GTPase 1 [Exaiptasia diaphana]|nr:REM2- and Rab-like small GTPase 1 [Exaiptasia diaphana]
MAYFDDSQATCDARTMRLSWLSIGLDRSSIVCSNWLTQIPLTHIETPGIQTTVIYWPVKLMSSSRVLMFRFQFWDCGDHAMKKYDHLLPVSMLLSI